MADEPTHGAFGRLITNRRTAEEVRETRRKAGQAYYQRHREDILRRLSAQYDFDEGHSGGLKEYSRGWKLKNPAKALLQQMRGSAKSRGQECTLTVEQVEELLEPMQCAETGLPLRWTDRKHDPLAPSPDRIDHDLGYVPGNVRIVAWFINRMRGDMALEELRELLEVLANR